MAKKVAESVAQKVAGGVAKKEKALHFYNESRKFLYWCFLKKRPSRKTAA